MAAHRDRRRSLAMLAALCALVLPHVPLLNVLTYPFELLVTAVHEMSHAIAALVTGGHVMSIDVFADTSGVTKTAGGNRFLISSAGYVGSTVFGCVLLVCAQRAKWHRAILFGLFGYFAAFLLLARNIVAIVIGLGVLAALWLAGRSRASVEARYFVLDFIAISSCLYAFNDVVGLLAMSAGLVGIGGPLGMTDAHILASTTGVAPLVWALGWAALSGTAAGYSVRAAWRMTETPDRKSRT